MSAPATNSFSDWGNSRDSGPAAAPATPQTHFDHSHGWPGHGGHRHR
jgi:hypothetical protein